MASNSLDTASECDGIRDTDGRPRIEVPKEKVADLRYKVKQLTTRHTTATALIDDSLQKLNPILRGWAQLLSATAPEPKTSCRISTGMSATDSGDGCVRSTRRPMYVRCYATAVQVVADARVGYGKKRVASNFRCRCSRSSATSGVGCHVLTSPSLLESRMHSERCMSGSARGRCETAGRKTGMARMPYSTETPGPREVVVLLPLCHSGHLQPLRGRLDDRPARSRRGWPSGSAQTPARNSRSEGDSCPCMRIEAPP